MKSINWNTTTLCGSQPSRRPPTITQLAKRAQLKAEIDAMKTNLSEEERAAIENRIKGQQCWYKMGA